MDEDDFGPDPSDKLFEELDKMVEFARECLQREKDHERKFDIGIDLMTLIMEEVPENSKMYQQGGGAWIAEAKYHHINFICVAGKKKPEAWAEALGENDSEDP